MYWPINLTKTVSPGAIHSEKSAFSSPYPINYPYWLTPETSVYTLKEPSIMFPFILLMSDLSSGHIKELTNHILAILEKKPDVTVTDHRKLTALHYAVALSVGKYESLPVSVYLSLDSLHLK